VLRHHSNRYLSLRVQLVQTHLRLTTTPNVENRKFKIITNRLDILERENLLHNRILNALESKKKPYTAVLFFLIYNVHDKPSKSIVWLSCKWMKIIKNGLTIRKNKSTKSKSKDKFANTFQQFHKRF